MTTPHFVSRACVAHAYSEGVETVIAHGAPIRVYSVAKTVTDCFKFRNKIGLDVALEALKEAWRKRKITLGEVYHFAKINRVEKVMQPYLEAVLWHEQQSLQQPFTCH